MEKSEWQKQTVTFDFLKKSAKGFPLKLPMLTWLRIIGVVPMMLEWRRSNRLPNTNLDPDKIPAGYLAEVAYEWDQDGRTTPAEFIEALAFEVNGTASKNQVASVLRELGAEGIAW